MIGSATGLTFNDFAYNLLPVIVVIMAATLIPIYFIWGQHLKAAPEDHQQVMQFNEREAITDQRLLKQCLSVIGLVIGGFVFAKALHLEAATVAMTGAALLLLLANLGRDAERQSKHVLDAFNEVEWITIFFFVGLFIVVHGVDSTGLLKLLADKMLALTGGNLTATSMIILWSSAILSAIIDNIPFVATMIPLIKAMAPTFGGPEGLMPLWWALVAGRLSGGNGTLDRGQRQPGGRRFRRPGRPADPLHAVHPAGLPDHAHVDRHRHGLSVLAVSLSLDPPPCA